MTGGSKLLTRRHHRPCGRRGTSFPWSSRSSVPGCDLVLARAMRIDASRILRILVCARAHAATTPFGLVTASGRRQISTPEDESRGYEARRRDARNAHGTIAVLYDPAGYHGSLSRALYAMYTVDTDLIIERDDGGESTFAARVREGKKPRVLPAWIDRSEHAGVSELRGEP